MGRLYLFEVSLNSYLPILSVFNWLAKLFRSSIGISLTIGFCLLSTEPAVGGQSVHTPERPGAPSESKTKSGQLRIATWNLNNLERTDTKRISAIASILISQKPDLVALQEIADQPTLVKLLDPLRKFGYKGFISRYIPYNLKLAFLYNSNTVDSISSYSLPHTNSEHWAGRIPYVFQFSMRFPATVSRLKAVNIHAKADIPSRSDSYNDRMQSAESLYRQLSNRYPLDPLIIMGDFNDDIDHSVYHHRRSPWYLFHEDLFNYRFITSHLTRESRSTTQFHQNPIDHLLVSDELFDREDARQRQLVSPIQPGPTTASPDTLSDHYMVVSSLNLTKSSTSITIPSRNTDQSTLHDLQNYPNPLHKSTSFKFQLDRQQRISLTVYNLVGRAVKRLVQKEVYSKGVHYLQWNPAIDLPSGVYRYRLLRSDGKSVDRFLTILR